MSTALAQREAKAIIQGNGTRKMTVEEKDEEDALSSKPLTNQGYELTLIRPQHPLLEDIGLYCNVGYSDNNQLKFVVQQQFKEVNERRLIPVCELADWLSSLTVPLPTPFHKSMRDFRGEVGQLDKYFEGCRFIDGSSQTRTDHTKLNQVVWTIIRSAFLINLIRHWACSQSAHFKEDYHCVIEHLQAEPVICQTEDDMYFPSYEYHMAPLSPSIDPGKILQPKDLMRARSEYTDTTFKGLPRAKGVKIKLGVIGTDSVADREIRRGVQIMAPLGLLMDNRLSYQHSVGRQWFNDYAKDCSMSDAEEVDEVRDILGKGGDSRVPHSLQVKTMKVRRREDGTPYAIYGEVGFRYQDPLPWIDEEELCCVMDQLKESSDEGDQVKLAELTKLTNS